MRYLKVPPLLALLALALWPTIGHAETSSEKVYPLAGAGVKNEPVVKPHPGAPANVPHPAAHPDSQKPDPSVTGEEGAETAETATGPAGEPHSEGHRQGKHHQRHPAPPGKGGGHPPGDGGGSSEGTTRSIAHTQDHPTSNATSAPKSTGGGSSPVLLILIAVAILAVGSVGIALYRERKQGGRAEGYPGS